MEESYQFKVWGGFGGLVFLKRDPHGTRVWKEIRKEWESFFPNTMCSVGNGRRVRFWKDFWCGKQPLSITFRSLFSLAVDKEALVADLWNPIGEEGGGPLISLDLIGK